MCRTSYVKLRNSLICLVGVARFELATSRPPDARATKLRYTPTCKNGSLFYIQQYIKYVI